MIRLINSANISFLSLKFYNFITELEFRISVIQFRTHHTTPQANETEATFEFKIVINVLC